MAFTIKSIFGYLKKYAEADIIHIRENEIVMYKWKNERQTDLVPVLSMHNNLIEQIYYPRSIVPLLYKGINIVIGNDLTGEEPYVRDMRKNHNEGR